MSQHKVLNSPAIRRMPTYYHKLMLLQTLGEQYVSTSRFAKYIGLDSIVVRKDFELTGATGGRGIGYKVSDLMESIRSYLGWDQWLRACLVGAGSLGTALLGYHEFAEYGLNITAVFDSSPARIGTDIYGHLILDAAEMGRIISSTGIELVILCVPGGVAQSVADVAVEAGVKLIWNFANTCLQVPADVIVQREVIAGGFALLSRKRKEHLLGGD